MSEEEESMKTISSSGKRCFDNSGETSSSKRRRIGDFFSRAKNYVQATLSPPPSDFIKTEAFLKMPRLKVLKLNNVTLRGEYEYFPKDLVWLCWRGCSLKFIPTNFCLRKLVVLDMRNSSLQVWHGKLYFPCLKILKLSHSHLLATISDFNGVPSLEKLILKDCINLVKIDDSIGILKRLVLLNLSGCQKLTTLPTTIASLDSLRELFLVGCSELKGLPKEMAQMDSLQVLFIDGVPLNKLCSTEEPGWQYYSPLSWLLSGRERPESTTSFFEFLPRFLVRLSLSDCNLSDDNILKDLSLFCSLEDLDISSNPITTLPESIMGIPQLKNLNLEECPRLLTVPKLPNGVLFLGIDHCTSLIHLPDLSHIKDLYVLGCKKLVEIEGGFKLQPIQNIDIERINVLRMCFLACNIETLQSIETEIINVQAGWLMKTSVQVLYECGGTLTVFLPGSEIPSWYTYQEEGSSLSFQFKFFPGNKMIGLNLCTIYELERHCERHPLGATADCLRRHPELHSLGPTFACIENTTKNLRWIYCPVFHAIRLDPETLTKMPELCKDMSWFSHFKSDFGFEDGDEVKVEVFIPLIYRIKKVGVHIIYEQDESQSIINSDCWQNLPQVQVPPYQRLAQPDPSTTANTHYFLSHNRDYFWQVREFCGQDLGSSTFNQFVDKMTKGPFTQV